MNYLTILSFITLFACSEAEFTGENPSSVTTKRSLGSDAIATKETHSTEKASTTIPQTVGSANEKSSTDTKTKQDKKDSADDAEVRVLPVFCVFNIDQFNETNTVAGSGYLTESPEYSKRDITWSILLSEECNSTYTVKLYKVRKDQFSEDLDLSSFTPLYSGTDLAFTIQGESENSLGFHEIIYILMAMNVEEPESLVTELIEVKADNMHPYDINRNGSVTSLDALIIVNYLNRMQEAEAIPLREGDTYYDSNRNGTVSSIDSLVIINYLDNQ